MKKISLLAALLLTLPVYRLLNAQPPAPDQTWKLDQSSLTYHMSHPMHEVDGTSHAALGKGVCHAGQCDFLVAAAVKSFDSGDSNRDLHMIQTTRGAQFPIVQVRFRLAQAGLNSPTLDCDLEVQFAGNTAHYTHVIFQQTIQGHGAPHHRRCALDGERLQDRSTHVPHHTHQERDSGPRGHAVARNVVSAPTARSVSD